MKVKLLFEWFDICVGFYYDRKNKSLYILPIPFVGIKVMFKPKQCKHDFEEKFMCLQDRYVKYICKKCKEEIFESL